MQYLEGNDYHGFRLKKQEEINEIKSTVRVFEHEKSGARLIHLENNDDDKLFSIGFRTTPADSTGVAHILEHSVLCGSKKFKTKDPFGDIAKGSLHTFLNAMTYTDKTIYPVGSRNQKDFMNLMDVYLDAVLNPRIYENHNILRQEGWRYELDNENKINYKGVVYSEMQGALSSPEETIINSIYSTLFPGTTYQYVSGGDPEVIPNLTQENFEKFHSRFYHPSNSYIYLYGDENLDDCLKFIDEEYLSKFDRIEVPSEIKDAVPFEKMTEYRGTYSINENDDDENKEFFALNFAYGKTSNAKEYLTHKVLYNMFVESSASPVKRALLDAGIGESLVTGDDMNMDPTKELLMPIVVKNAAKGKEKEFKENVLGTLRKLAESGIDKNLLYASLNTVEFELREITRFKGLQYNNLVLESWLYDGEPDSLLKYDEVLKELKADVSKGYFESFINKNMLENKHCSLVVLSPEKGLARRKADALCEKLEKYKQSLSKEELYKLRKDNDKLKAEQMKKDTEEEKATIPQLSISEIDRKVEKIPRKIINIGDVEVLNHDIFTGKIEYLDFLFDISFVSKEELPYLSLLTNMLGKINTKKRNFTELATEIAKVTGGIDFEVSTFVKENDYKCYIPKLILGAKSTVENVNKTIELINEIITDSEFEDAVRISEVLKENRAELELEVINRGNEYGVMRASSMFSTGSQYEEELHGASYFKFLCDIDKNFETVKDDLAEKLKSLYSRVFNKNNLIVSVVGEDEDNAKAIDGLGEVLKGLKNSKEQSKALKETRKAETEGIITSSNVQYVIKGYNISALGYNYSGNMKVMCNILDNDYLYPEVRLQGGAYGCYSFIKRNGNFGVFSYRDTHLKRTVDVYKRAYKFLDELDITDNDMDKFIVGTIGGTYRPLTPKQKGEKSYTDYITGRTDEDNQKEKDEILSTTLKDIKGYSDMMKKIMDKNICCVVGNEANILNNKDMFDKVENI